MSHYLWSGSKWQRGVKEIVTSFPCSPMNSESSWKKMQIKKKIHERLDQLSNLTIDFVPVLILLIDIYCRQLSVCVLILIVVLFSYLLIVVNNFVLSWVDEVTTGT